MNVLADRDKIDSVISNLISNAIKYSPKEKEVSVTCAADQSHITVNIKDTGMGIKAHDLNKIFVGIIGSKPTTRSTFPDLALAFT